MLRARLKAANRLITTSEYKSYYTTYHISNLLAISVTPM